MSEKSWSDVYSELSKGGEVSEPTKVAIRELQAKDAPRASHERFKKPPYAGWEKNVSNLPKRFPQKLAIGRGGRLEPRHMPTPPPVTCPSNFNFEAEQSGSFTLGSNPSEALVHYPSSVNSFGSPFYQSAVKTDLATGAISIGGVASAYLSYPDSIFPGGPPTGIRLAASITQVFDLPGLAGKNPKVVYAVARISQKTSDVGWLDPGPYLNGVGPQVVALWGFITITLTMIPYYLEVVHPGSSALSQTNTYEFLSFVRHAESSGFVDDDDFYVYYALPSVDVGTNLAYIAGITKMMVEVAVEVDCFCPVPQNPGWIAGVDFRQYSPTIGILPDPRTEGVPQSYPLVLETIRLCSM